MSATSETVHSNALIHETSPYLQQHANNPVHWYPWGEEALRLAREQDKPILLSVGYSACHWCHVMAHESFEDPETAQVMNELFINIKVDREERPDLDKIYQMAHQILTRRAGGWPLTMFLTPDAHYPFFGGTYFPKEPRFNLPAFKNILYRVAEFYRQNRHGIVEQCQQLAQAIEYHDTPRTEGVSITTISPELLNTARQQIEQSFDSEWGGFSKAPKFPHLTNVERLFHHYHITAHQENPDEDGLQIAMHTLTRMALGGIYDQVGGGFCRYSVDDYWMIPHFEKMLYDNAPFLTIYSEAWQLAKIPLYKQVAQATADWVLREMQLSEGGFYSTLDADSEGVEGKFYVWTPEEIKGLLSPELYAPFAYQFGLNRPANFEETHWHLFGWHDREAVAVKFDLSLEEVNARLDKALAILFQAREQRVHPQRDEKILTAWNGMMIKALATAGRIFKRTDYIHAAEQSLNFIRSTLWKNGKLLATYKDGKAHLNAYLDDYAFLIEGILTLLQCRWNNSDYAFMLELVDVLLHEFEDKEKGGFFFTGNHHEQLIARLKPLADEAIPSGNGVAAVVLGRLGHLLGNDEYLRAAARTVNIALPAIEQIAYAHNTLLLAVEDYLFPPQLIIIRADAKHLAEWQAVCQHDYAPQRLCFAIPNHLSEPLTGVLANCKPQGEAVAYICHGYQCSAPIHSLTALEEALQAYEMG
ncbi:thioredoxin domain-containing protein [Beggiatoa alba B18LD]|uniref:Thioredoxin domain-containing protein n=1 Tax=Beggiatoa alba B18LD TaxID=395493 RepID=I3CBP9_9GAMM|nr:thioredoxin domain-containing protein [Beggiatoa alba]EIJ41042.1 thioredoxin domain-containing protein [Beggiatoa alba B18LD]